MIGLPLLNSTAAHGGAEETFSKKCPTDGPSRVVGVPARCRTASGVTDGPFVEAKEIVGGYMVVSAESYDRAIDVARECPGVLRPGSSLEIREIAGP